MPRLQVKARAHNVRSTLKHVVHGVKRHVVNFRHINRRALHR